jgi:hypothetical protein
MCTLVCVTAPVAFAASDGPPIRLPVPAQAAAAHYTLRTFYSRFGADEVDLGGSSASGFKWYPWKFFGKTARMDAITVNADGSATLFGDTTGPNGQLATASPAANGRGFVGVAFGGGGYFEATLRFNPQDVARNDLQGWPSWWSMAIEHLINRGGAQWPGQEKGYEHFIEVDFFEYDLRDYIKRGQWNAFGGAMHDWFGLPSEGYKRVTTPHFVVVREVPSITDFTQNHRYGFLWVPATGARTGYAEYYFDGQKVGSTVAWKHNDFGDPPPRPPWLFSVIDSNHLVLILGTGVGEPLTVTSVEVWQASDDKNMRE